ncbi:ABC transporter substrate-binding protein [Kumtagia ephedrae]|uniref:ABC transporter substrate-binding protein n=1 Tax=Kumtagia ephedrae TaxID=2116701 RepID=A0A2P7RZ84_9HYPH|nr:ABC transporter substrate-binding protein [Mesorhizobium ephedrae]PSJ55545.1 ABC transporter substrate-binding protein [Mesorhizobium ephedrae]
MKLVLAGIMAGLLAATAAQAEEMVFTSWGGTTQEAQAKSWAEPFTAETGIKVLQDGPTDYGKLKAMVDSGSVSWDVIDVEMDFAIKAAKDGLLEPIDFNVVPKADLDPRFTTDHAVGSFYYSFVLAWNKGAVSGEPVGWADMFDLTKYPGKRTFYKWSAPGVIEIALLADGVPADKLYPLDLDRAFKKLDTIKPEIVWWSGGAQSQQLIASGEATFGQLWNGRVFALQEEGADVGVSWNQNMTAADVLVVPKGAKNKDLAMKFLAAATSPSAQASFAEASGYAPINTAAKAEMPEEVVKSLPDAFVDGQINLDMNYWAENRDAIATRWYAWQAQ